MTDRHVCEWEPVDLDHDANPSLGRRVQGVWLCSECGETCRSCVVTDGMAREHPTGNTADICDRCLRVEQYVLDDITDALGYWDERDRHRRRSPTAFGVVGRVDGTGVGERLRYPEDVGNELLGWAVRWAAHTGAMTAEHNSQVDYLKSRLYWAAHNRAASSWDDYRAEVRRLRAAARSVVGLAPDRHPEACMHCGGRIVQDRADEKWRPLPEGLSEVVRCTGCGLTWGDREAFQRNVRHHVWALPHDHPAQLVTLDIAAKIFPDVPRPTMRSWIHRDRRLHDRSLVRLAEWEAGDWETWPDEDVDAWADWEATWHRWHVEGHAGPRPAPPGFYVRRLPECGTSKDDLPLYRLGDLHAMAVRRTDDTRTGPRATALTGS